MFGRPSLDWVVVGGGLQGCHLATVLLDCGVPSDRLAILDAAPRPLAAWVRRRRATGMRFLRSPGIHHIGLRTHDLHRRARGGRYRGLPAFTSQYARPAVRLFEDHSLEVAERLEPQVTRTRVQGLEPGSDAVRVETEAGTLSAGRVLLALGPGRPRVPAPWDRLPGEQVSHVFSPSARDLPPGRELVVGGGITAVQLALARLDAGAEVTILARHALRVHEFDSDPGWLSQRYLRPFLREPDPAARRARITAARHRGSVPRALARVVQRALRDERLTWRLGRVTEVGATVADGLSIRTDAGDALEVDHVHLATGFEPGAAAHPWLSGLAARHHLPVAPCGTPRLDAALRWHPRLHVAGALADLELGPTAGNVVGARTAGDRLRSYLMES